MASEQSGAGFDCSICDSTFDTEDELRSHRIKSHKGDVCAECGAEFGSSPFTCNFCGEMFCNSHRLPEKHECIGLEERESESEEIMYNPDEKESKSENVQLPSISAPNVVSGNSIKKYFGRKRNYSKFLPLIGIVLLLYLSSFQSPNLLIENGEIQKEQVGEKISATIDSLQNTLIIDNNIQLLTTFAIVFTIWSVYRYWLRDWKYTSRNSGLLEKLIVVIVFLILIQRHVNINTTFGKYADLTLFLMVLYLELAGTWFLAKTIDGIDLSSDLYNWGLRLLGGLTILFGGLLFVSSSTAVAISDSNMIFENIYWIGSICLMLLGLFMEYRSFRRHPAIKVW